MILVRPLYLIAATVSICRSVVGQLGQSPSLLEGFLTFVGSNQRYARQEPPDQARVLNEYDFIVVGAGSAGCVVANRLSEVPEWKVLLIEAGVEENYIMDIPVAANMLQFSYINWKYKTVPSNKYCLGMDNNQCKFPRGKVMGGSSVLNYMIYTRGNRRDYDRWAELGNPGWDYQSVLKYFKKLEDMTIPRMMYDTEYHNRGGYQTISEIPYKTRSATAFLKAGQDMGYPITDLNGATQIGFSYHQVTMRNGTRCSTSRAYLHPIKGRKNLHIKKRSMVTKILIDPNTKQTLGVEFVKNRKKYTVYARKEVILSAGAINTPQLLMVSGVGPKDHLKELGIPVLKNSAVGLNLMDHVALGGFTWLLNDPTTIRTDRLVGDLNALTSFTLFHQGPVTIPGGTEAIAFFDMKNQTDMDGWPNMELLLISGTLTADITLRKNFGITDELYNAVYKEIENKDGVMVFVMISRPKSRGRIMLQSANPTAPPLIYPNYFDKEEDLDIVVQGVRMTEKLMKTKPMKKLGARLHTTPLPDCKKFGFDSDDYWKCAARQLPFTVYHLSGTTKMGPQSDPEAVVDARLRVRGIKGLRVMDTSIIPEIPTGHTNSPAIMIGEKGSDLVKEDWGIPIE